MSDAVALRTLITRGSTSAALEAEHEIIDAVLKALASAVQDGLGGHIIAELLDGSIPVFSEHFAHEEEFLYAHQHSDLAPHREAHEKIFEKLVDIRNRITTDECSLAALDAADLLHFIHDHIESWDTPAYDQINALRR